MTYATQALPALASHAFGDLRMATYAQETTRVFDAYKYRAELEIAGLQAQGITDVPAHLYRIRNALAHGKTGVLTPDRRSSYNAAIRALPIVKLLARTVVEP